MPKVAKGKRKRAYRPKTTTGCLTCKVRRVKCDEARPTCRRCTSTGRVCDGYSNAHSPHSSCSNLNSVRSSPSYDTNASSQSNRSFAFFVQRTRPQLAGFFSSDFWETLVLQAAYHEPAIRHAIVAIGSIHELFENETAIIDANRAFALEQYHLALKELLAPLSETGQRGVDVCLISSILFTCFENMQGNYTSAGAHIRSGARLLRETLYDQQNGSFQHRVLGSKSPTDSYAPLEVLARLFVGLDPQLRTMIGSDKFKVYEMSLSEIIHDEVPLSFSSIEEAKKVYEYGICLSTTSLISQLSRDQQQSHTAIEAHIALCETVLSKFSLALQNLAESKGAYFTPTESIAISVLRLHLLDSYVSFHVKFLPSNYQLPCDRFKPQMEEMVALGEKIISFTSAYRGQTTSFCLDMGIIIPLYTVASKCRDSTLRRKAIVLLRSTSRQEGLWNSWVIARAAERIMEIEESTFEVADDGLDPASVCPILELDGRGCRLQYGGQGDVSITEEIIGW